MKDARTRLIEWLERSKLSQRKGADLLGVHYTFLNQILSGRRSPALATAVKIEQVTGVPVEAWVPTTVDDDDLELVGVGPKRKSGKR
jgi:transcriptional regulator with XRE-family HTH domain